MKDVAIRAFRTWLQVFIGLLLASWVSIVDIESAQSVLVTAAVAAIPAALSFIQNTLEEKTSLLDRVPRG